MLLNCTSKDAHEKGMKFKLNDIKNGSELSEYLKQLIENDYKENDITRILNGFKSKKKVTLRVNTIKSNVLEIAETLEKENIEFEKVDWFNEAFILKNIKEDEIRKLDIYQEGKIYLQSLSSMIPPIILRPKEGKDILDMAAAPGGKTTEIAALTQNKAYITACEKDKIRLERLKFNVEKQGVKNVNLMNVDARNLDDFFSFDQILLDSPCSGSGTIELDEYNEYKRFTKEYIQKLTKTQSALLDKAVRLLKKGGELVYSTCSILKEENDDIIEKILNKYSNIEICPIEIENFDRDNLLPNKIKGTICICPSDLYEGFYVAKLAKKNLRKNFKKIVDILN